MQTLTEWMTHNLEENAGMKEFQKLTKGNKNVSKIKAKGNDSFTYSYSNDHTGDVFDMTVRKTPDGWNASDSNDEFDIDFKDMKKYVKDEL